MSLFDNRQWHKEQAAACAWYLSKVISGGIPPEQWESDGALDDREGWTLEDEIENALKDLREHIDGMALVPVEDWEVRA